ncbi:Glycosyltransferase [endosymbiont of Acanthamoeba sp. UWC8]|uniref:glycosyltransferase n=1 Tax=endosymbiont of Acanthamoeba sp. UWC8 TaxID=86106 RepID=UPI0004D1EDB6|nr:glycosyltransferase [endosymbiont of Acanthamoeba sp. UWC8]AIF82021.1 Glycosyltransferase [endosymbiont of Acanthamoeba sp. UWC8]
MIKHIVYYAGIDLSIPNACALHVAGIVKGFAELGYNVTAILPKPTNNTNIPFLKEQHNISLVYHSNPIKSPRFLSTIFAIFTTIKLLYKIKPQLFYLRMSLLSFILLLIAKILKIPTVSEHNGWMEKEMEMLGTTKFVSLISRLIQILDCKLTKKILTVTQGLKEQLKLYGIPDHKFIVVENGTDTAQFTPIAREKALKQLGLNPNCFYLGFIGVFTKWQGLDLTLSAFYEVAKYDSNIRLILAGDGAEKIILQNRAQSLGLKEKVYFLGAVPIQNANNVINCFDIALSNATVELNHNIGVSKLKIRDYAAAGRTILASHIPGNIELDNEGILLTHIADSIDDLVEKILSLKNQPELMKSLQCKSREYAIKHFSWKQKCREILANHISL